MRVAAGAFAVVALYEVAAAVLSEIEFRFGGSRWKEEVFRARRRQSWGELALAVSFGSLAVGFW